MLDFRRAGFRLCLILAAALVATAAVAPSQPAGAQDLQGLIQKVDRLQRELSTLQRQVYSGGEVPAPSPELSTSPALGGEVSPTIAARLQTRVDEMENQLRNLTGQIEEANYQVSQVAARLDKLIGDVDFRLQELERRMQTGEGGAALPPLAGGPSGEPLAADPSGEVIDRPRTLGQVSQSEIDAFQAQQGQAGAEAAAEPQAATQTAAVGQAAAGAAAPGGSVKADYDHAFGLLRQANYGEAESALKTFLEEHPDDVLAGNAKYWLGETYYVRGDFRQAAVTFAEGFQRYPDSAKAADNLLKLGMSLAQLDKKEDSCGAFGELLKRYPDASASVQQRAALERERLGCQ